MKVIRSRRRMLAFSAFLATLVLSGGSPAQGGVAQEDRKRPPLDSYPHLASHIPGRPLADAKVGSRLIRATNPFARLWNRQFFVGPGVASLDARDVHAPSEARFPGDFEPHEAILLAVAGLSFRFPEVLTGIVASTSPRLTVVCIVSSPRDRARVLRLLAAHHLPPDSVRFLLAPTDTIWVRDFGPVFIEYPDGTRRAIDPDYGKPLRAADDFVPAAIAREFNAPIIQAPLTWHGGNLLGNGRGLLVTTTQAINANVESGQDLDAVTNFLDKQLGVRQLVVLEHLRGEPTGHADVFACFTDPNTVVVGKYSAQTDPVNAGVLDRNATRLAKVSVDGKRLRVIRIPMPTNRDGNWRTYTNVIFANGLLLVPTYRGADSADRRRAMAVFHRLLPDWEVASIDATRLITQQGALRCVTQYVPATQNRIAFQGSADGITSGAVSPLGPEWNAEESARLQDLKAFRQGAKDAGLSDFRGTGHGAPPPDDPRAGSGIWLQFAKGEVQ